MRKKKLTHSTEKSYPPKEKLRIVEEIRAGLKTVKQASEEYQVPISKLGRWNRWYFKIRLLRYFRFKSNRAMANKDKQIEQLKKQLQEARAQLEKAQLKNVVLEKALDIASKELEVDIRKKYGSKQLPK